MKFRLFERVILTESIPEEGLWSEDVGTIVEYYPTPEGEPDGYEVEFFAANGDTVAVVSLPETVLRAATEHDRLAVRLEAGGHEVKSHG